jgi:hypothetical protein
MARFYSNENFPVPVVHELRRLGHDVLTMLDTGQANQSVPDEEVLQTAWAGKRVLLTLNRRHFIRLHDAGRDHSGIVACTFDPDFNALAKRIHDEIKNYKSLAGTLIRINRPSTG